MASVKVAVRVRPFNKREDNLCSESVVLMEKQSVSLLPPPKAGEGGRTHAFTFDYAYYSHDPSADHFVNQETVFENLGSDVVSNAFKGYNVCVFAYGQTGSGKTHTMMGSEADPGLIPRICQELFARMKNNINSTSYRTEVSYLEIYNEKVKDLLGEKKASTGGGHNLKVREDPRSGPYVQNLSKHLVLEYDAIISLMSKGNSERTTASTNMNNTSSRSHAIFTITFMQASVSDDGLPRETISKVHLVDLAGSERADATGATGQRLKEGAHINKSLVTLGSVISALADASNNQQSNKKVFVPYRDSVLTWLLRDSLGGNSQTIMIATISPADVNHGETLSTLRYANRAKNIINKPTVNEDPNVKLIRELREEIERLKESLIVTTPDPLVATEIAVKEARERTLTEAWTEKWKEAANILSEQKALGLKRTGLGVVLDSEKPHLIGIVEDVLSTGIILYHLKEGDTIIGTDETSESDIVLRGPAILPKHCVINLHQGQATLTPQPGALCLINASRLSNQSVKLSQGCVIVLGKTNMFRYNDPSEVESLRRNGMTSSQEYYSSNQSLLSESLSDLRTSRSGGLEMKSSSSDEEEVVSGHEKIKKTSDSTSTLSFSDEDLLSEEHRLYGQQNESGNSSLLSTETIVAPEGSDPSSGEMNGLYGRILEQKEVIMKCLENEEVDVDSLNEEILVLQELQSLYEKKEFERIRRLWAYSKVRKDSGEDPLEYEEKLAIIVEQEVDRRLFQEKILKAESEYHEREHLRSECDRELNYLRREHEREIYILKRRLYESHVAVVSGSLRSKTLIGANQAYPAILAIPSYQLVGQNTPSAHVEYNVKLTLCGETPYPSLLLRRRYKTFRDLHRAMLVKYGPEVLSELSFPPRRFIGSSLSQSLSNERQRTLQIYLNCLVQIISKIPSSPLALIKDPFRALAALSPFFNRDDGEQQAEES